MIGEPILVMLIEDNADHAELVIRTLEEHKIANKVRHFLDGQSALDYLFHCPADLFPSATSLLSARPGPRQTPFCCRCWWQRECP